MLFYCYYIIILFAFLYQKIFIVDKDRVIHLNKDYIGVNNKEFKYLKLRNK